MADPDDTTVGLGRGPRLTDADLKHHSQELGLMGFVFGSKEHAPLNIAGLVLVLCIIGMVVCPFLPDTGGVTAADMLRIFGSIALASLTFLGGYLGGRATH